MSDEVVALVVKKLPVKRQFPRGTSPFCSPSKGDLLKNCLGEVRLVHGSHDAPDGEIVEFQTSSKGKTGMLHSCLKSSWSQWCSRTGAQLLMRSATSLNQALGELAAEYAASQMISEGAPLVPSNHEPSNDPEPETES